MFNRKIVVLVLVCLMVAGTMLGCTKTPAAAPTAAESSQTTEAAEPSGGQADKPVFRKVNVALNSDPETMAPWGGATVGGKVVVLANIYETLFTLEQIGGEMKPGIASSYEQIDDYTYRIKLYENVTDSMGNPVTSADVVFSYQTGAALGNMATFLAAYDSIAAVDDYTVDLKLNSTEMGGLLNTTTMVFVVSQKSYEADPDGFASKPVGTGPYMLKEWTPGATVLLEKNPAFWQADDPHNAFAYQNCDEIECIVYTEPAQIAIALETGEVDFAANVANSDLYLFGEGSQNPNFNVYQVPAALNQVILFNCSEGRVTANQMLRQAVCYAIDTTAILDGAYNGLGNICKTYGNPSYGDYVKKWDTENYYDYNLDKAKELVTASGYAGEPITIMVLSSMSAQVRSAEIIQAYLAEAGITANIVTYDATLYNTYRFDPTQWDMQVTNKGSGDYICNIWKYNFDHRLFKGKGQMLSTDEHLQELLEAALSTKTHNDTTMDAFHQYLKEMAYGYGMLYSYESFIYVNTMDSVVITTQNAVLPGSCTYSADFVSH